MEWFWAVTDARVLIDVVVGLLTIAFFLMIAAQTAFQEEVCADICRNQNVRVCLRVLRCARAPSVHNVEVASLLALQFRLGQGCYEQTLDF